MSAFSFTAPIITEEEEEAELDALNEEERRQLKLDMYGKAQDDGDEDTDNDDDDQLPEALNLTAAKLQALRDALEGLSETEGRAYREALEIAPDVVTAETDLASFLWADDGEPAKAAQRVSRYWQIRRETFGPDLFALPMTLNGAVAGESSLLSLGLAFILPKEDKHGRAVVFCDRTRYTARVAPRDAFLRMTFYLFHSMVSHGNKRKNEFVVIINNKVTEKEEESPSRCHPILSHIDLSSQLTRHFLSCTVL